VKSYYNDFAIKGNYYELQEQDYAIIIDNKISKALEMTEKILFILLSY